MASIKSRPQLPIWGVLVNKTNTTSHPLKTAILEEWNKPSEEFMCVCVFVCICFLSVIIAINYVCLSVYESVFLTIVRWVSTYV